MDNAVRIDPADHLAALIIIIKFFFIAGPYVCKKQSLIPVIIFLINTVLRSFRIDQCFYKFAVAVIVAKSVAFLAHFLTIGQFLHNGIRLFLNGLDCCGKIIDLSRAVVIGFQHFHNHVGVLCLPVLVMNQLHINASNNACCQHHNRNGNGPWRNPSLLLRRLPLLSGSCL